MKQRPGSAMLLCPPQKGHATPGSVRPPSASGGNREPSDHASVTRASAAEAASPAAAAIIINHADPGFIGAPVYQPGTVAAFKKMQLLFHIHGRAAIKWGGLAFMHTTGKRYA
jgi:hypothetical protein